MVLVLVQSPSGGGGWQVEKARAHCLLDPFIYSFIFLRGYPIVIVGDMCEIKEIKELRPGTEVVARDTRLASETAK